MSEALVPAGAATSAVTDRGAAGLTLPQVIVDAGPDAAARFLEFFAGRIANARTRAAYGRAVGQFLAWCEALVVCPRNDFTGARMWPNGSSNGLFWREPSRRLAD